MEVNRCVFALYNDMRKWVSPREGVTLVEIMMAFFILALALLPVSSMIGFGHRGTQKDFKIVMATELLIEKMNQVSVIPFRKAEPLIAGVSSKLTTTIFAGTNLEVILGTIQKNGVNYSVSSTLSKFSVTFSYRPIDFTQLAYNVSQPNTWSFTASRNDVYDGSSFPYKVLKALVEVEWVDPITNKNQRVEALNFIVDLED